jgi:ubiquinone/menaquinone biosynthesis C-methylase UbiE
MPVLTRRRKKLAPRAALEKEFLKGPGITIETPGDFVSLRDSPDCSQRYVAACQVLECCADVLAAFHAMHRVLKPGGVIFLSISNSSKGEATPLGHLAADYVHGPDQPDGVRQHAWTSAAWLELIQAMQAGLGLELEVVRRTKKETITVMKKAI